jgi:nitroreductase
MDLKKAIESRTSIRKFSDAPVDISDIREIVRLAGYAPSINNYQPWKYYIIYNKKILNKMADAVTSEIAKLPEKNTRFSKLLKNQTAWFSSFFRDAPMLIALTSRAYETVLEMGVIINHDELDKINNYPDLQSSGASIQNLLLAATEKGYGTCWMTGPLFAREKIREILHIDEPWKLISFVAIGHAERKTVKTKDKRDISKELVIID